MNKSLKWLILLAVALFSAACENPNLNDEAEEAEKPENTFTVRFKLTGFEQHDFNTQATGTRAATDITQLCSRIDLCAYTESGTVKAKVSQDKDDDDFGSVALNLPAGKYRIVALAHNGIKSATMTDLENIKFYNNKMTDTFYYSEEIDINSETTKQLEMHRAVAAFCFVVKEKTPSTVKQMKFYYTGGSSTLDGKSGTGCVKSKQTEIRDVPSSAYTGASEYMVYTFPRTDSETLKMTVTALSESGKTIKEQTFEGVPVTLNQITQYSGNFFDSEGGDDTRSGFTFITYDEWTKTETEY